MILIKKTKIWKGCDINWGFKLFTFHEIFIIKYKNMRAKKALKRYLTVLLILSTFLSSLISASAYAISAVATPKLVASFICNHNI